MAATLKLIYETAKVRLGVLIMACVFASIAMSPGEALAASQLLVIGLATLAAASAAGAFNQYYERDVDARMQRTQSRPFVTGRFEANGLWLSAILVALLVSVAAMALATNWLAAAFLLLGAFTYGVVYTVWLKRRTWLNIVIGGLSGSFAVMVGSAAMGAALSPAPLVLAVVLFLWTPPHFWALAYACRHDYEAAGIPMLPVVSRDRIATLAILLHVLVLVPLSLVPYAFVMGEVYLAGALTGGAFFMVCSVRLHRQPTIPLAWRTFAASIVQLGLLLVAAVVDRLVAG
ncbi:MAG: heme o synthase [Woeseiaceae bacterium]|nr:heme o synthase [Woeseiaceae bacterium]